MSQETIFSKIISKEIPADIVMETDAVLAFHDIAPQAPVHVLVIPKVSEYRDVTELASSDPSLLAEIVDAAKKIANELGNGEFRLVFNNGASAGQTVFHVHAHVLMGELTEETVGS